MRNHSNPTIAISNRIFSSTQDLIDYAFENNLWAIDYSFPFDTQNFLDLRKEVVFIEKIAEMGFEIRFHCPFKSIEIAHTDKDFANYSLQILNACVDIAVEFGVRFLTTHIGLGFKSANELDYETSLKNLSSLVNYGERGEITVCLENLTSGWTNNPHSFLELIEKTGASVTFDLGHSNSSPWFIENEGGSVEFLRSIASYIVNAHIYEKEEIDELTGQPYHVPPHDLDSIRPLLLALIDTKCDWWLIELKIQDQVDHTLSLLRSFLDEK
ncbi:MAG: TIM barrel protein [Thermodesulfobacteriota bacterium]